MKLLFSMIFIYGIGKFYLLKQNLSRQLKIVFQMDTRTDNWIGQLMTIVQIVEQYAKRAQLDIRIHD